MVQFHPNLKTSYAVNALCGNTKIFTTAVSGTVSGISVYSGTQPSAAELIANWNANYRLDSGANRLMHYTSALNTCPTWTRSGSTFAITAFGSSTATAIGTGTASFAVFWTQGQSPTLASLSAATIPAAQGMFLIVPVTTTAGNGVLRFSTLSFATGQPNPIVDGALVIL